MDAKALQTVLFHGLPPAPLAHEWLSLHHLCSCECSGGQPALYIFFPTSSPTIPSLVSDFFAASGTLHMLVVADLGTAYPHFVQGSVQRFLPQKSCFLISLLRIAFLPVFILSLASFFFSALSNRSELHVPPLECQH